MSSASPRTFSRWTRGRLWVAALLPGVRGLGVFVVRRFTVLAPQLLGISVITFVLVRLLPGDPAIRLAGPAASPATIEHIRALLGLNKPIVVQYWLYITRALHGDLGRSTYTGNPVATDIAHRFPATLELITASLVLIVILFVPLGMRGAVARSKGGRAAIRGYSIMAGALPDFWIGLVLIFVFYYELGALPPPEGQLSSAMVAPRPITGMIIIDSLIDGQFDVFQSSLTHLVMPMCTLAFVYGAFALKMTRSTVSAALKQPYILFARGKGLPQRDIVAKHALRASAKPILTTLGITYGYLLGGAVLVETVFAWGGLGQYVVQAIINADYAAVQGFVLVASTFTLLVYLVLDLLYMVVDPRTRQE